MNVLRTANANAVTSPPAPPPPPRGVTILTWHVWVLTQPLRSLLLGGSPPLPPIEHYT